jgi:hypothetical protein
VADCGLFTHFEMLTTSDWSGSGGCPPIAGQFTRAASRRTRGGGLWTVHSFLNANSLSDWSGSGACPPTVGQCTHVASLRTRGGEFWTITTG